MSDVFLTEVLTNTKLAENIHSVTFGCRQLAASAKAGQFVHIKCGDALLLRRPVSICNIQSDTVQIVFEIRGKGTKWLSGRQSGGKLDILGPLGNGFSIPGGDIIVTGGGIGIPPMLYAARSAKGNVTAILGYQTKDKIILADGFKELCSKTIITTDDGSAGIKGTVLEPLRELVSSGKYAAVLSCGPFNMQKAVASVCRQHNVSCQVSLEQRMGCGAGACLVCVCPAIINGKSQMIRVCADGPVFDANNIVW